MIIRMTNNRIVKVNGVPVEVEDVIRFDFTDLIERVGYAHKGLDTIISPVVLRYFSQLLCATPKDVWEIEQDNDIDREVIYRFHVCGEIVLLKLIRYNVDRETTERRFKVEIVAIQE